MNPVFAGMLAQHQHRILLTHGDISPRNIMVRNGHIAAIIDWQYAGWYPEYWEFTKASRTANWRTDWPTYFLQTMKPYFSEEAAFMVVTNNIF
jgi:thiamine kinase-like enzyme